MQVTNLLEKQLVEEAVLLAETIAAVEATRDPRVAEDVSPIQRFTPFSPGVQHCLFIFYFFLLL